MLLWFKRNNFRDRSVSEIEPSDLNAKSSGG